MTLKKMKPGRTRLLCLLLAAVLVCAAGILPGLTASAASGPTSLGLAAHGLKAYRDGWQYESGAKGGTGSDGIRRSDCAGLIYAYFSDAGALGNCQGGATSQVNVNCVFSNSISEGIPNIHGLALTMPDYYDPGTGIYGHIGIYVGNNKAADNSDYDYDMRLEPVVGSGRNWNAWHVFDNGLKYPVNGWYALDGKMVHYTNYEYDADTVIDGYRVGSDGCALTASGTPAPIDYSMLSSQYASASQVAGYLRTKYSGWDNTSELIYGSNGGGSDSPPAADPDPEYNGKITGEGVRLRKQPNTQSGIVTVLSKGAKLDILEEVSGETIESGGRSSNKWYSVTTAGGSSGYVCALFAERVSAPAAVTAPVIQAAEGYVTITAAPGAEIYYTTDCTQPNEDSTPYTGPIYMTGYTYKAIAVQNGKKSQVSTASVLSNSSVFKDFTTEDWFFSDVDKAVNAQIFQGNGNGTFSPRKEITREQFVKALANLDRVDLSQYARESRFSDVKDKSSPMTQAINWAEEAGIINGFPDNTFRPTDTITREQMCVILTQYAGLERGAEPTLFEDDDQIGGWARDAVYACRDNYLIQGMGGNKFAPKGTATRAQACVITVNLYNNVF